MIGEQILVTMYMLERTQINPDFFCLSDHRWEGWKRVREGERGWQRGLESRGLLLEHLPAMGDSENGI